MPREFKTTTTQINGITHDNDLKDTAPIPEPKINEPKGKPVFAPSAESPPPITATPNATVKTFCSGKRRHNETSVLPAAVKTSAASSWPGVAKGSGQEKEIISRAKAATSKAANNQWQRIASLFSRTAGNWSDGFPMWKFCRLKVAGSGRARVVRQAGDEHGWRQFSQAART